MKRPPPRPKQANDAPPQPVASPAALAAMHRNDNKNDVMKEKANDAIPSLTTTLTNDSQSTTTTLSPVPTTTVSTTTASGLSPSTSMSASKRTSNTSIASSADTSTPSPSADLLPPLTVAVSSAPTPQPNDDAHFKTMLSTSTASTPSPTDQTSSGHADSVQAECSCRSLRIIPRTATCVACNTHVPALTDWLRAQHSADSELIALRKHALLLKKALDVAQSENVRLTARVDQLEDEIVRKTDDAASLKRDLDSLSEKFVKVSQQHGEALVERDKISEELEELTRTLFEQANVMVADEAKRRHEIEISSQHLFEQLEVTKKKLEAEKRTVLQLRRTLSSVSISSFRADSMPPTVFSPIVPNGQSNFSMMLRNNSFTSLNDPVSLMAMEEWDHTDSWTREDLIARGSIPPSDNFASLDIDLIQDKRFYEDFMDFIGKAGSVSLSKWATHFPFVKACIEEHVEPCARLTRLNSRRIIEAAQMGTLKIVRARSTANNNSRPTSIFSTHDHSPEDKYHASHTSSHLHHEIDTGTSPNEESRRNSAAISIASNHSNTPRPVSMAKSGIWSSIASLTSSVVPSSPTHCAGCGREGHRCLYMVNISTDAASLDDPTQWMYLDTWCRDRLVAVWEFFVFLRRIRLQHSPATLSSSRTSELDMSSYLVAASNEEITATPQKLHVDVETNAFASLTVASPPSMTLPPDPRLLYTESLRLLRQCFYARVGVMSYFRKMEDELKFLSMTRDVTANTSPNHSPETKFQQQQQPSPKSPQRSSVVNGPIPTASSSPSHSPSHSPTNSLSRGQPRPIPSSRSAPTSPVVVLATSISTSPPQSTSDKIKTAINQRIQKLKSSDK